jgi:hypothetical protein
MQADFTLYIRDCLDCLGSEREQRWWTETLLYSRGNSPFEIYARAQSKQYFELVKQVFDIHEKQDLSPLLEAYRTQKLAVPKWQFESFNPARMLGYEKLATRP